MVPARPGAYEATALAAVHKDEEPKPGFALPHPQRTYLHELTKIKAKTIEPHHNKLSLKTTI
jgi:hypothetical protein